MADHDTSVQAPPTRRLAVLALGGHALGARDDVGTAREAVRAASRTCRAVVALVREGFRVLVVHGGGAHLDRELLRADRAALEVPPRPLEATLAATQGAVGHRLVQGARNALKTAGLERPVTGVLTQVLVNPHDPSLEHPATPIGPLYSRWRARELSKGQGVSLVEEAGRGWRQVVARPRPVDVLDVGGIEALLAAGHVVVAGGAGGVPMAVNGRGELVGVAGVVSEDQTAALLGGLLGAHLLVVLTELEHLFADFGGPGQRPLERLDRAELRELFDDRQFPAEPARTTVEAALEFLDEGGEAVVATSAAKLAAALADRTGTRISRTPGAEAMSRQLGLFGPRAAEPDPGA